jgi:hypothetical protein
LTQINARSGGIQHQFVAYWHAALQSRRASLTIVKAQSEWPTRRSHLTQMHFSHGSPEAMSTDFVGLQEEVLRRYERAGSKRRDKIIRYSVR